MPETLHVNHALGLIDAAGDEIGITHHPAHAGPPAELATTPGQHSERFGQMHQLKTDALGDARIFLAILRAISPRSRSAGRDRITR